jgi:hypothetical protein
MKKAAIMLAVSALLLALALATCLPGICGCVSVVGIPDSPLGSTLVIILYMIGLPGIVISTCWLAFLAVRFAVRRIRNA